MRISEYRHNETACFKSYKALISRVNVLTIAQTISRKSAHSPHLWGNWVKQGRLFLLIGDWQEQESNDRIRYTCPFAEAL